MTTRSPLIKVVGGSPDKNGDPSSLLSSYGTVMTTTSGDDIELGRNNEESLPLLASKYSPTGAATEDGDAKKVAQVIYVLLWMQHYSGDLNDYPKTNPKLPPELRYKRHRNIYIYKLNQFRHWWKTSRLLVRLSGGLMYCVNPINWAAMATYDVHKRKQAKVALKQMKSIGRGGPSAPFLSHVKPFTRTVRIILAVARGLEAKVDNRMYEVLVAEGFAFMGNRCSRWIARTGTGAVTASIMFPISAKFIAPYLEQNSRPVIVAMGFIRAVLPFAFSFQGSRIGRQLTFNTWKYANYRWSPVQSVMDFNKNSGVYQSSDLDPDLVEIAHNVAVAIGHGEDPVETRLNLSLMGFDVVGSGSGGYAAYRRRSTMDGIGESTSATTQPPSPVDDCVIWLHITPYGPSILNEVPRYVVLERKRPPAPAKSKSLILAAAIKPEASICGFTYSGAYFQSQEWSALTNRFRDTLDAYQESCKRTGTLPALRGSHPLTGPPRDLSSLKDFIRRGNLPRKQRKDKKRFVVINKKVEQVSKIVTRFQKNGTAPKRVIVYLEGLDCSAKSSTGGLVCSVLEQCGYAVRTAQHNRPPTPEQQKKPWMDRGRFEYPQDVYGAQELEVPEYTALVWDRGPAGDFVYGKFADLSMSEKLTKYEEFREYDTNCRRDDVLFLKLLFVADKDSIASTLGKRLAHKKIVQDLRIWLDANSVPHDREGLDEIEHHIDPTDFVAFNKYKRNLSIFTEFARNTDSLLHRTVANSARDNYDDHWTVVNTCKRYPARLQLLSTFERQMKRYALTPTDRNTIIGRLFAAVMDRNEVAQVSDHDGHHREPLPQNYVEDREHGISIRAVLQSFVLAGLLYFYAYITWHFDIMQFGKDSDD